MIISAIALALNPIFHAHQTKHIEVDYHFIRERIFRKAIDVNHVATTNQVANVFTKGLGAQAEHVSILKSVFSYA